MAASVIFSSQLIVSFGYTPNQSLLYGTPGGAIEVVFLIVCGYLGDRWSNRILFGCSGLVASMVGMILIVALPLSNNGGRLAGYYLTQASPTGFVALLSLIATNVAGYTKKTTVAALYLICYCVGNIIGTNTFLRPVRHDKLSKLQGHKHSDPKTHHATYLLRFLSFAAGVLALQICGLSTGIVPVKIKRKWRSEHDPLISSWKIRSGLI